MIHYELYPYDGNYTGVISLPHVTTLGGEPYKYESTMGGGKSRRKRLRRKLSRKTRRKKMIKSYR